MANKSKIVNGVQYKQCGTCKQFKPLDGFYKLKHGSLGVMAECKECGKQRAIKHRKANPEYEKDRYRNDPLFRERRIQRSREWRRGNLWYCKEWYKKHPNYLREWIAAHPSYHREWQRRFREAHPDYYRNLRLMKQKA